MPIVAVPKALRDRLGDEAVDGLIAVLSEIDKDARQDALALAEEKFERRLVEEIAKLRQEMGELRQEMHAFKAELIKWMFLFWIGQLAVIAGLLHWIR